MLALRVKLTRVRLVLTRLIANTFSYSSTSYIHSLLIALSHTRFCLSRHKLRSYTFLIVVRAISAVFKILHLQLGNIVRRMLVCWSVGWLIFGSKDGRSVCWSDGRSVGQMVGQPVGRSFGKMVDWLGQPMFGR